jgi:uncharacterized protein (DUF427 family)
MGLSWQQGPLSTGPLGKFIVPEPLPTRLLYVERLRRRMRVRLGGRWIAESENVVLLFEPGRYPVAYFPEADISPNMLESTEHTTQHPDLGLTSWYSVRADQQNVVARGAWQHTGLPAYASELQGRIAFAWRAMERSTKRTSEFSAMRPTLITASTFARPLATSWSARATGSSPIRSGHWPSTNPASRRAGTFHATTSISPPSRL